MKMKKISMPLKDYISSETNLYNAIYCMESYVFEKGLLSSDDLELFVKLKDKYNFTLIEEVIKLCKDRLSEILGNNKKLFTVEVFFKIKKWDEQNQKVVFRPIHTARLIDQICMVAMLLPLMFDDSSGKRKMSELTKLIPHNFYGNIPSTDVANLFEPWKKKYKEYNKEIISHCKEYQENHRYRTEITLDIKNFFPSISPQYIYDYILEKLCYTYTGEDLKTLRTVLTKLLFFEIKQNNLKGWEKDYYGKSINSPIYMNYGIAQGLPQSYFFGNLCMIEICNIIHQHPDFTNGDSYFYVDDSVIYIEKIYAKEPNAFDNAIKAINNKVSAIGNKNTSPTSLDNVLDKQWIDFQKGLNYQVKFHESGKSDFSLVDDADLNMAALEPIRRTTSMASSVYSNLDEVEDQYCKEKLEKIQTVVDDEIKRLKQNTERNTEQEGVTDNKITSRLKMLKRYKRFFLFRLKLLEHRIEGGLKKEAVGNFTKYFKIHDAQLSNELRKEWFEQFEEEIFQSEARLLIGWLSDKDASEFKNKLCSFEENLVARQDINKEYLFMAKDFEATLQLRTLFAEPYQSLRNWTRMTFTKTRSLSPSIQYNRFVEFIDKLSQLKTLQEEQHKDNFPYILKDYTFFVLKNSEEYSRQILNAYYSEVSEIYISDAKSFTKNSSRELTYTELRILARLRNRVFCLNDFSAAVHAIKPTELENRTSIDSGLMNVLGIFIDKVRNPERIDNIILTHRVVKGLWYNGSKFLHSYTTHNEEHAITLIIWIVRLVKAIDFLSIKQLDYYILFLACYLHDISMVLHPNVRSFCRGDDNSRNIISKFIREAKSKLIADKGNQNNSTKNNEELFKEIGHLLVDQFNSIYEYFEKLVRDNHPQESARKIRDWGNSVLNYLEPLLLSEVAKISESHGIDATDVYGLKSEARNAVISEKYMMILLRLADLMDVANNRINYYLLRQNVSHMAQISQFHWISHLITDEIKVRPHYDVDAAEDKNGKPKSLGQRSITEKINVNLRLNVKYLSAIDSSYCSPCIRDEGFKKEENEWIPEDFRDMDVLSLKILSDNNGNKNAKCPILCKWTMMKHDWLINELTHLQEYLNSVNHHLFHTEIRLNVFYEDRYHLDSDLFDSVCQYLCKDH